MTLDERLARYQDMVRAYHATLDLVSEAALENLSGLVEQAQRYAETIQKVAPAGDILDLGSGAGLPGAVIAATFPERRVWLVERRRRRATFLKIVVGRLELDNAVVIESDVTQIDRADLGLVGNANPLDADRRATGSPDDGDGAGFGPSDGIKVVTAQAVASFADVYCLTRHLHGADVTLISRKGPWWRAEVDDLADRVGAAPAVAAEPVPVGGGTLVSIEVRGGLPCPRSA